MGNLVDSDASDLRGMETRGETLPVTLRACDVEHGVSAGDVRGCQFSAGLGGGVSTVAVDFTADRVGEFCGVVFGVAGVSFIRIF